MHRKELEKKIARVEFWESHNRIPATDEIFDNREVEI